MKTAPGFIVTLLIFGSSVVAQEMVMPAKSSDEAAIIKAEAEKSSRAFSDGDYGKLIDLAYPPIVKMSGGKMKLLGEVEKSLKAIRDSGLKIVSHTVGEPEPSIRAGALLVSLVPTSLKMESADSFFSKESFWLAVSTDDGKTWSFIDGSNLNAELLKTILPEAANKLKLPANGQLVRKKKPAD